MADLDTEILSRTAPLYERVKRVIPPFEWATFAEDVVPPGLELLAEVFPLPRVHEGFVFSRPVVSLSNRASHHKDSTHIPGISGLIVGGKPIGKLCRVP